MRSEPTEFYMALERGCSQPEISVAVSELESAVGQGRSNSGTCRLVRLSLISSYRTM